MDQQLKSNLTSSKHWLRLLFMMFFAVCLQVSFIVMTAVVCVQFLFALITGEDNRQLRAFGDSLSRFIYQTFEFLTYNSEQKPFPFADWPESSVESVEVVEVEEEVFDKDAKASRFDDSDVVDIDNNDTSETVIVDEETEIKRVPETEK